MSNLYEKKEIIYRVIQREGEREKKQREPDRNREREHYTSSITQ